MAFLQKKKNELSALQEETLHDFKESFVEQYQETPLYAAFLMYFFSFYQYLFKCLRLYLVKIGLRKPDEPKERGNKVSMHATEHDSYNGNIIHSNLLQLYLNERLISNHDNKVSILSAKVNCHDCNQIPCIFLSEMGNKCTLSSLLYLTERCTSPMQLSSFMDTINNVIVLRRLGRPQSRGQTSRVNVNIFFSDTDREPLMSKSV